MLKKEMLAVSIPSCISSGRTLPSPQLVFRTAFLGLSCNFHRQSTSYRTVNKMLGGDEVSALVMDLGSYTCKAGYAGDDTPKAIFPSAYGYLPGDPSPGDPDHPSKKAKVEQNSDGTATSKNQPESAEGDKNAEGQQKQQQEQGKRKLFVGSTAVGYRRDNMEIDYALKNGVLTDWDAITGIWEHAIRDQLCVDPSDYALLIAEPSFSTRATREKTLELLFETLNPPAVFCNRNAVLSSFSCGKATSVVVDCGHSGTTVSAVHDGYLLTKSLVRSPVGGSLLTHCTLKTLQGSKFNAKCRPRYSFKRKEVGPGEFQVVDLDFPNTTESFKAYMQRGIASDVKEAICRVPDTVFDETSFANVPTVPYELPDGQTLEVGGDRFKIADIPFSPSLTTSIPGMESAFSGMDIPQGVTRMILECIGKCDPDIRRDLFSSVLLSGGTTTISQFKERLERELVEESPPAAKVKVLASGNMVERKFGVWLGGSILASLGSFQQLWLSKAEFEEHGASYIHRKCP